MFQKLKKKKKKKRTLNPINKNSTYFKYALTAVLYHKEISNNLERINNLWFYVI